MDNSGNVTSDIQPGPVVTISQFIVLNIGVMRLSATAPPYGATVRMRLGQ